MPRSFPSYDFREVVGVLQAARVLDFPSTQILVVFIFGTLHTYST
jgi:thiosulfate reductase cytochrome b subunit